MVEIQERDYQIRVINKVVKAVQEGHKSVLIESPTGSGKTIMGYRIAEQLIKQYGWTVGWTCMRKVLLHQAEMVNHEKFKIPGIKYFSTFDKEPPLVDVVIEDEAQHSAAQTSVNILAKVNPKLHLAMTATPFRTDRMKLCFSKVIRDAGLRQLVDAKWLSPYHLYISNLPWQPDHVANMYLADQERWGPSVIFFQTVAACYECQKYITAAGVESEVVHGSSDQERQIARFNSHEIPLLINVQVLTEGFDAPHLRTGFLRPASKAPTMQMGGRVFRTNENKPFANIVQNVKARFPFSRIASPEKRFRMDCGIWVPVQPATETMLNAQVACVKAVLRSAAPKLPAYLSKHKTKVSMFGHGRPGGDFDPDAAEYVESASVNTDGTDTSTNPA